MKRIPRETRPARLLRIAGTITRRGSGGHSPPFLRLAILPIVLVALVLTLIRAESEGFTAHAAAVAMFKDPASANLFLGGEALVIAEEVSGIPDDRGLKSFEFQLAYDSRVLRVSVSEGEFLGSTGRPTQCVTTGSQRTIHFACHSQGSNPGPTGSGILAIINVEPAPDLRLRPVVGNGIVTELDDFTSGARLVDTSGDQIPIGSIGDSTLTVRALEGDINFDCRVDLFDEQQIAVRYGARFGSLFFDPIYDLEPISGDGDIDVKDLQQVFGRVGSTCEEPFPPQPPSPGETPVVSPSPPISTPTATPTGTQVPTETPAAAPTGTQVPTETPTATPTEQPPTETPTATPAMPSPTPVGVVLPVVRTPVVPEELPPTGGGPTLSPTTWTAWLLIGLAVGALALMGVTRVAAVRKARPAAAGGQGAPLLQADMESSEARRRLLLKLLEASWDQAEGLAALASRLENLSRRGPRRD